MNIDVKNELAMNAVNAVYLLVIVDGDLVAVFEHDVDRVINCRPLFDIRMLLVPIPDQHPVFLFFHGDGCAIRHG